MKRWPCLWHWKWVCSDCGWTRKRANPNWDHQCKSCGGFRGEFEQTTHFKGWCDLQGNGHLHSETPPDIECLCNVGAQHCPLHPNHRMTQFEKIEFRKTWDQRVEENR